NDFSKARINFSADVNSIFTNNEQRDAHLRNGDFFDADNHPRISFVSQRMEKLDDENFKLHGILTMRGTSREEVLNVEFGGLVQDPWGNIRAGFTVTGKINRTDYGVSFGAVAEAGRIMLSDDVRISAQVQFVKETVAELQPA
ncbi:MAG TPA: YceI family protein, partial [Chitinophagaceae bacterium]|nr:YceI family protein [Chitinophagaceae bacterium]